MDLSLPAASLISTFTGEGYDQEKELEDNYGDLLHAADGEEDDSDSRGSEDSASTAPKEDFEPQPIEELIDRYTTAITIEHVIGDNIVEDTLTIPRRRPFKNIFRFKISLRGIRSAPWRRLLIPESFAFYDFHVAIQDAMGWLDYHLHHFEVPAAGSSAGPVVHLECPWLEPWDRDEDWLITTEVRLRDHFHRPGDRSLYRYDYGDGWEMDILLEEILLKQKGVRYPSCLDGALSGPPEDCGGIQNYRGCIRTARAAAELDPGKPFRLDKDDKELLNWLGNWDPDNFNPRLVSFGSPRSHFKNAFL